MFKIADKHGFTLVELIIALALVSMVGTGLFSVYWVGNKAFTRDSANSDIQYMARKAMEDIADYAVQADPATIQVSGTNNDILEFTLTSGQQIKYVLSPSSSWLNRQGPDAGPSQPIVEKIAEVEYQWIASKILRVRITAVDGTNSYSLTSQVVPRIKNINGGSSDSVTVSIDVNDNDDAHNNYNINTLYFEYGANVNIMRSDGSLKETFDAAVDNSTVNTAIAGSYTVLYTVRGSSKTATRTVNVYAPGQIGFQDDYIGDDGVGGNFILNSTAEGNFYVSTDSGTTWNKVNPEFALEDGLFGLIHYFDVNMNDVVSNGQEMVAVGKGLAVGRIGSTNNGTEWEDSGIELSSGSLNAVTWGNGLFVAVGNNVLINGGNGRRIYTSPNGSTWTARTSLLNPLENQLNDVFWGGNKFITVGNAGDIYASSDGTDWIKQNSENTQNLNGVVWSPKKNIFIAVGDNGTIVSSDVNDMWTVQTFPLKEPASVPNPKLNAVTWGVDKFIAVGENGTIISSTDGVEWSQIDLPDSIKHSLVIETDPPNDPPTFASIKKISCARGIYIATVDPAITVNDKSVLLQSTDGENWVLKTVD